MPAKGDGFGINVQEGQRPFAVCIGNLFQALIDQRARRGAAGVEIGGKRSEGRGIRHQ
jgi:hypothetical protein